MNGRGNRHGSRRRRRDGVAAGQFGEGGGGDAGDPGDPGIGGDGGDGVLVLETELPSESVGVGVGVQQLRLRCRLFQVRRAAGSAMEKIETTG